MHDFIVFDAGIKKLCRHNQYFGVRAAQESAAREGGIIWHTQGSGKSLTMVWLAKWIRENVTDARVLIITDRTELDKQIEGVFKGVNEEIYRTKSGPISSPHSSRTPWLICSLVHKFARQEEGESPASLRSAKPLPSGFKPKGDIILCGRVPPYTVREAPQGHDSDLPHAVFIGFTGTPLIEDRQEEERRSLRPYIHTYKFDEAVKDGVVLDLATRPATSTRTSHRAKDRPVV